MSTALHTIQLEQALFELNTGVVGKRRAIDRLVAATIVGGPVLLAGPQGVGKSHLIAAVARVFGLQVGRIALDAALPVAFDPYRIHVADADEIDTREQIEFCDALCRATAANVILTTTLMPTALSSRVRDVLLAAIEIPYPTTDEEIGMALGLGGGPAISPILKTSDLAAMRADAMRLPVADAVVGYAVRLVQATRSPAVLGLANLVPMLASGSSPRASIGLMRAARGLAMIAGRGEVTVQDVYDAAFEVLVHRIELSAQARELGIGSADVIVELLSRVPAR